MQFHALRIALTATSLVSASPGLANDIDPANVLAKRVDKCWLGGPDVNSGDRRTALANGGSWCDNSGSTGGSGKYKPG